MKDVVVGVYYFAGWWREQPNKWTVDGRDWRTDYPDRVPLLGEYVEASTLEREIEAASSHGVDFFQILWYPQNKPDVHPHLSHLNDGLRFFTTACNASKMYFTLEYVNHDPFSLTSDADWDAACVEWTGIMRHRSYLRVGDRPVFKIHSLYHFLQQNEGNVHKVAQRVERLRRLVQSAGVPNPLVGAGVMATGVAKGELVAPFDYLTTYMDVPNLPQQAELYPYNRLLAMAEEAWRRYAAQSGKPYVPYLPAGWDPRPWKDPRASFAFPTREQWKDALARAKDALQKHERLGYPRIGGRQKALLIYAWNEYGEGGIVAPTRGEGYMKLEAIREVFGKSQG
ncbi:MAG: hypothetical protein KatS3mg022_3529 [Armatimonadota bacterium]|nr:MAG: hypothetical protein KatS3mg022_3529 [Armatimonadota bacterium]